MTDAISAVGVGRGTPDPAGAGRRARRLRWCAATAAAIAAVALPWLVNAYIVSLASYILVIALLAMSTQLLVGVAGLPSLGQAAYLGVGAYTAAVLARTVTTSGPVHLAAAVAAGAGAAAVTGVLAVRVRGITFLMITFAIGQLAHAAAVQWTARSGGSEGLHTPAVVPLPGLPPLELDGYAYLYVLACAAALATALAVLLRSRYGLALRGIADHEPRMQASGHPTGRYLLAAYGAAGALAGGAGALLVAAHRYVSPADLSFEVAALGLLAAVLGTGTMPGACLGAVLVVASRDWLGGILGGHGMAMVGLLLLAVVYAPRRKLGRLLQRVRGGRT